MAKNFYIESVERITSDGEIEKLSFTNGVNLLTGEPNAGKTTWLRQIDFVLGKDSNVFDVFNDTMLSQRYQKISLNIFIGDTNIEISRVPLEAGFLSKIYINENAFTPSEFSTEILNLLEVPSDIKYPKGNPYTTQWITLGFRSILRHIYRREDSWSDIADKQPSNEQYATQFLLLGIAEKLYSKETSSAISKEKKLAELIARKDQFTDIISQIAKEMSSKETFMNNSINVNVLGEIIESLNKKLKLLQEERDQILQSRLEKVETESQKIEINLSAVRAKNFQERGLLSDKILIFQNKIREYSEIQLAITDELSKLKRTKKSGIISEMKITHCPACDQDIEENNGHTDTCFLCKRSTIGIDTKKSNRLDFEMEQLIAEQNELVTILKDHKILVAKLQNDERGLTEDIFSIDKVLEEVKRPLYALNDNELSDIDIKKGRLIEQVLNYQRLSENYKYKQELEENISILEKEIKNENQIIEQSNSTIDFETASIDLAKGMQEYVDKISKINPKAWTQGRRIEVSISESKITFYVNNKIWSSLGGLDKQLFLLSYHYGLLNLSYRIKYNYPAITIIDLPPDLGRAVETSYNYLLTPFVELTNRMKIAKLAGQVIIVGRAFKGNKGVNEINLETGW